MNENRCGRVITKRLACEEVGIDGFLERAESREGIIVVRTFRFGGNPCQALVHGLDTLLKLFTTEFLFSANAGVATPQCLRDIKDAPFHGWIATNREGDLPRIARLGTADLRSLFEERVEWNGCAIGGNLGEEVGESLAFGGVVAEVFFDEALVREEEAVEGSDARLEPLDGREHLGHPNAAVLIGIEVAG